MLFWEIKIIIAIYKKMKARYFLGLILREKRIVLRIVKKSAIFPRERKRNNQKILQSKIIYNIKNIKKELKERKKEYFQNI